jgi:hypothetical protein
MSNYAPLIVGLVILAVGVFFLYLGGWFDDNK